MLLSIKFFLPSCILGKKSCGYWTSAIFYQFQQWKFMNRIPIKTKMISIVLIQYLNHPTAGVWALVAILMSEVMFAKYSKWRASNMIKPRLVTAILCVYRSVYCYIHRPQTLRMDISVQSRHKYICMYVCKSSKAFKVSFYSFHPFRWLEQVIFQRSWRRYFFPIQFTESRCVYIKCSIFPHMNRGPCWRFPIVEFYSFLHRQCQK